MSSHVVEGILRQWRELEREREHATDAVSRNELEARIAVLRDRYQAAIDARAAEREAVKHEDATAPLDLSRPR